MEGYPLEGYEDYQNNSDLEIEGFYNSSRRLNDENTVNHKNEMEQKLSDYQVTNFYNDSDRKKYMKSLDHPGLSACGNKDGYGSFIDTESNLLQSTLTNPKYKQQLITRPFKGWPYMGAGETHIVNPDLYSRITSGADTRTKKAADSLSGVSIDRFIPMVPCLASNVQNTEHIIPEYWVRGGESSRAQIQNIDYYKLCGIKR